MSASARSKHSSACAYRCKALVRKTFCEVVERVPVGGKILRTEHRARLACSDPGRFGVERTIGVVVQDVRDGNAQVDVDAAGQQFQCSRQRRGDETIQRVGRVLSRPEEGCVHAQFVVRREWRMLSRQREPQALHPYAHGVPVRDYEVQRLHHARRALELAECIVASFESQIRFFEQRKRFACVDEGLRTPEPITQPGIRIHALRGQGVDPGLQRSPSSSGDQRNGIGQDDVLGVLPGAGEHVQFERFIDEVCACEDTRRFQCEFAKAFPRKKLAGSRTEESAKQIVILIDGLLARAPVDEQPPLVEIFEDARCALFAADVRCHDSREAHHECGAEQHTAHRLGRRVEDLGSEVVEGRRCVRSPRKCQTAGCRDGALQQQSHARHPATRLCVNDCHECGITTPAARNDGTRFLQGETQFLPIERLETSAETFARQRRRRRGATDYDEVRARRHFCHGCLQHLMQWTIRIQLVVIVQDDDAALRQPKKRLAQETPRVALQIDQIGLGQQRELSRSGSRQRHDRLCEVIEERRRVGVCPVDQVPDCGCRSDRQVAGDQRGLA